MQPIVHYEEAVAKGAFHLGGKITNIVWAPDDVKQMISKHSLYLEEIPSGNLWFCRSEYRSRLFFQIDASGLSIGPESLPSLCNCVSEIILSPALQEKKKEERAVLEALGFVRESTALLMACTKKDVSVPEDRLPGYRKAESADLDSVRKLNDACFDRLTDAIPTEEELADDIGNGRIWVIGNEAGTLFGSMLVQQYNRRRLIRHVAVSPEWRNKGFGTALVTAAISDLQPGERAILWVKEENAAAIRLYERLGFQPQNRLMEIWTKR